MFRTAPVAEPNHDVVVNNEPVPLSHLGLDLPAPATGWLIELDRRGIAVLVDDIGRPAVSRDDARRLIAERHDHELRARELREEQERQMIEADERRRAQLWQGVPWWDIGMGVSPAAAMLRAGYEAERPRSVYTTLLEQELGGEDDGLVFHSLQEGES